jgi:ubiquinone/menaquinone biosynthesis C-methylase UbiE
MFSDPQSNVNQLALTPGMKIADLGAGSGFYTIAAAKSVGGSGRVYAVDIQKDLLAKVKTEAARQNLTNIEVIWGDLEKVGGTKIQDAYIDALIISNILFQIEQREPFFQEIKRILKPNREVLFVDWSDSFGGLGPHPNSIIPQVQAKEMFEQHGFVFVKNIGAGDHHYGMIFQKK